MKNQSIDSQDVNSITTIQHKNKIGLPLLALFLDLAPILLMYSESIGIRFSNITLILIILLPISGLITGVIALSRGKARIGIAGKILAIIAIALPLALVAFIVIFFIGAATGLISFM